MTVTNPPLIQQLMTRAEIHQNTKDNSWDYLNELSESWKQSLLDINNIVATASRFLDSCKAHHGETNVLIEGLLLELTKHANHWTSLKASHNTKTGLGRNPDEHSTILNLGLEYVQAHEEFMLTTQFAAPRLQEIIALEEAKLRIYVQETEKANQASLADISINPNI